MRRGFASSGDLSQTVARYPRLGPVGVSNGGWTAPGEHIDDAARRVGEGGRCSATGQPHQVRRENDVWMVEQRVVLRRLGIEHVEADSGKASRLERGMDGPEVDQAAAPAVDQNGAPPYVMQEGLVDEVVSLLGQR